MFHLQTSLCCLASKLMENIRGDKEKKQIAAREAEAAKVAEQAAAASESTADKKEISKNKSKL